MCKQYTRSYLHHVVTKGTASPSILVTIHNVAYMQNLTRQMREAILAQRFPQWVCDYLGVMFPKGDVPGWVQDAMAEAGIDISSVTRGCAA